MKIYFIGIAGAGMHSLALYLSEAGCCIAGSDPGASEAICSFWASRGVTVNREQKAENIEGADLAVYSAAVPSTNPERKAAEALGIACSRGEALARFANKHLRSIAVCGTHGKGTVAAAIAQMLSSSGACVSDILGAVPVGREQPCSYTPDSDYLVCEVDESDRTNTLHRPRLLVINNIESDHLNTYRNLDDIVSTFAKHVRDCLAFGSKVVIHYSGVGAPALYQKLRDCKDILWVCERGTLPNPFMTYTVSNPGKSGCSLVSIHSNDEFASLEETEIMPQIGGRANAQNIATAAAVGCALGLPESIIERTLSKFQGLKDRCQIQQIGHYFLVTDYANHPTCVTNDISWIRVRARHVIAVYQPYRYSLMKCHWEALAQALSAASQVFILPFDSGGEPPINGLSSEELAKGITGYHRANVRAYTDTAACLEDAAAAMHHNDALLVFAGPDVFASARQALVNRVKPA